MVNAIVEEPTTQQTAEAKQQREDHKLEKRLCRLVGKAIVDYNMIEEGDRVMVCMSGGKDSYTMLDILLKLQRRAPINFTLVTVRQMQFHFKTWMSNYRVHQLKNVSSQETQSCFMKMAGR